MSTTTAKKRKIIKDPITDDSTFGIGLPNGQDPEPLEYDLRKISKFMTETGRKFIDLTEKEKEKFRK